MMPKYKIYRKAWLKWGEYAQLDMVIEECAELTKAIQKWKRKQSSENYAKMQEETADVEIMIEQMNEMYDFATIAEVKKQKLERLEKLVKK